ncbi:MAG TPA: hypothetical protein VFP98_09415 [Candidatus Polarisedimenticolia bacterium]|nr:hypothetical protein [Candidatus Polarisedimenticolia bacterium]
MRHLLGAAVLAAAAGALASDPSHGAGQIPACADSGLPADSIQRKVASLRQLVTGLGPATGQLEASLQAGTRRLEQAEQALAAGRLYLALEMLEDASTQLEPAVLVSPKLEALRQGGRPALDETLSPLKEEMSRLAGSLERASSPGLPAAVRAMRDAARTQAVVYGKTMDAWREIDEALGAVYYMGNALALARAASFYEALEIPGLGVPTRPGPIAPLLDRIEAALIAAYVPPVSVEKHADFIRASAAVKAGRELAAAGLEEGALLQYLRARIYGWPMLRAQDRPLPGIEALRASAADLPARIGAIRQDGSIGCLLWERALGLMDRAGQGEDPQIVMQAAEAIVEDVLPEYLRLAGETR